MSVVVEVLKDARTLVAQGWCQRRLTDGGDRFCALGAIGAAARQRGGDPLFCQARDTLAKYVPSQWRHGWGWWALSQFNDADTTTQRDMLDLFDKAIADLGGMA